MISIPIEGNVNVFRCISSGTALIIKPYCSNGLQHSQPGILIDVSWSQYTAPILHSFSRHWAQSQHAHIGLPDDGILKCRNM
jgi:hypothetical protein